MRWRGVLAGLVGVAVVMTAGAGASAAPPQRLNGPLVAGGGVLGAMVSPDGRWTV